MPGRRDEIERIFDETRTAAYQIIDAKGSTSYGIGMALARITRALLRDEYAAIPISTYLHGPYGVTDLYLGVPVVLGRKGVRSVVELSLTDAEAAGLAHSAEVLGRIVDDANLRAT